MSTEDPAGRPDDEAPTPRFHLLEGLLPSNETLKAAAKASDYFKRVVSQQTGLAALNTAPLAPLLASQARLSKLYAKNVDVAAARALGPKLDLSFKADRIARQLAGAPPYDGRLTSVPVIPRAASSDDIRRLGEQYGELMHEQGEAIVGAFVEQGKASARQTRWIMPAASPPPCCWARARCRSARGSCVHPKPGCRRRGRMRWAGRRRRRRGSAGSSAAAPAEASRPTMFARRRRPTRQDRHLTPYKGHSPPRCVPPGRRRATRSACRSGPASPQPWPRPSPPPRSCAKCGTGPGRCWPDPHPEQRGAAGGLLWSRVGTSEAPGFRGCPEPGSAMRSQSGPLWATRYLQVVNADRSRRGADGNKMATATGIALQNPGHARAQR